MRVRKATTSDAMMLARINELSCDPLDKLLKIEKGWVRDYFRRGIANKNLDVFILNNTGFVALRRNFPGYKNCEIFWLAVDKKNQGRGIGERLVEFIIDYAKKLKYHGIYLYTHPVHKPAISLYRRKGFKKINEFPNYYSNGDKSILMGRRFNEISIGYVIGSKFQKEVT